MAERDRIYPNDTLPVAYETRMPDPDNEHNIDGLPAEPLEAYARLYDRQAGVFLELGGPGEETAPCAIEPKTGTLSPDKGAIVSFVVTSEFTETPGDFTLLITSVFADGAILTEDRIYKVLEVR
jgi:hypothetical protein